MPARQQISLQPSLALMLAEHLHHPALQSQMLIARNRFRDPLPFRHLKDGIQTIRHRLIRPKDAEILLVVIQLDHIANEFAQNARIFRVGRPGLGQIDPIRLKFRHPQRPQQQSPIGVRIGPHSTSAARRQLSQLFAESSFLIE